MTGESIVLTTADLLRAGISSDRSLRRFARNRRENLPGDHGPEFQQEAKGRPRYYTWHSVDKWLRETGRGGLYGSTYYPNLNSEPRPITLKGEVFSQHHARDLLGHVESHTGEPEMYNDDNRVRNVLATLAGGLILLTSILALVALMIVVTHERNVAQSQAEHYASLYEHETSTRTRLVRYVQTKYALNERMAKRLTDAYVYAGERYDLDPRLLVSVSRAESYFQPEAVSFAGARGVMQVMPEWAASIEYVQTPDDLFDPRVNIMAGAHILRHYMDQCGGGSDIRMALSCYHGGPNQRRWGPRTRQYPDTVLAEYRRL